MKFSLTTKRNIIICFILCINLIAFLIYVCELSNDSASFFQNEPIQFEKQHLLIVLSTFSIHYYYFHNLNSIYFNQKPSSVLIFETNNNPCSLDQKSIETNRIDLTDYLDNNYKYFVLLSC